MGARGTPEERFWRKVDKTGDCWLWLGAHGRYGCFNPDGRIRMAHRWVYEHTHGVALPRQVVVMHLCDVPLCVRPDHLRAGSQSENLKDAFRKGRMVMPNRWADR